MICLRAHRTAEKVKIQHSLYRVRLPVVEDSLSVLAENLAECPHGGRSSLLMVEQSRSMQWFHGVQDSRARNLEAIESIRDSELQPSHCSRWNRRPVTKVEALPMAQRL